MHSQRDSLEEHTFARQSAIYVDKIMSSMSPCEHVKVSDDKTRGRNSHGTKAHNHQTPKTTTNLKVPQQESNNTWTPSERPVSPSVNLKRDVHRKSALKEKVEKPIVVMRRSLVEQYSFDSDTDQFYDALDHHDVSSNPLSPSQLTRQDAFFAQSIDKPAIHRQEETQHFRSNPAGNYDQSKTKNANGNNECNDTKSPTISDETRSRSLDDNKLRKHEEVFQTPLADTRSKSANYEMEPPFPWFREEFKLDQPLQRKLPYYSVNLKSPKKTNGESHSNASSTSSATPSSNVNNTASSSSAASNGKNQEHNGELKHRKHRPEEMSFDKKFDPYQVFEVDHKPCLILTVKVNRGRQITKGWIDYLDTPDPYIILRIKTAPDGRRRTQTIDNEVNPVWNEEFTFLLDENESNILQISLMEANPGSFDQKIGDVWFDLKEIPKNKLVKKTFFFNQKSEIDMEFETKIDTNPTLRYSLCLCPEEKQFLEKRRQKVRQKMSDILGDRAPYNDQEVPNIAIIGSGGGFRAMVGFSGVTKALADSGILDCATYMAGLSGSSWYLSTLYSHHNWPEMNPGDMQDELKNNIDSSLLWLLSPQSIYRYLDRILQKRQNGQPVSFTDIFGHLVGETLLKNRLDIKLTDLQEKVCDGQRPLPLMTCVNVKADRSARSFQEWVEFSPYEIGMPKYGTFMKSELFGSKFFMGKLCKQYPEQPLHFLQGIWGSAFCILFKRLLEDNRKLDPVEMIRQEMVKQIEANQEDESSDSSEDEDDDVEEPPKSSNGNVFNFTAVNGNVNTGTNKVQRGRTQRRTKQKSYWQGFLSGLLENKRFEVLNSRAGRAGVIHNFMRGLSLQESFPLSPFTPVDNGRKASDDFDGLHELHPTNIKHLYMVDAGLTFNSPYPLVMRPQRSMDIILSFDFSARPGDRTPPFKELLLAEKWARLNNLPFPPIDVTVVDREGLKELYIFKHPTDPYCPVILHFVLVNIEFRNFLAPGVPREKKEDIEFADFDIFDDAATPYSTFNFKYSHLAFERLSKLMEFNTLLHVDDIKNVICERINKKRDNPLRPLCSLKEVNNLRRVSLKNRQRLSKYISRIEERRKLVRTTSDCQEDKSSPDRAERDELSKSMSAISFRRNELSRKQVTRKGLSQSKQRFQAGAKTPPHMSGLVSPREADEFSSPEINTAIKRDLPGRRARGHFDMETARCNSIDEDDQDEKFFSCTSEQLKFK